MIKWRENGILELRPFTIPPLFRFSFLFGFCFLFVFLLNCYLICVFFFSFVCFYFFICVWTLWATIPLLSDVLLSYPRGVNKFILRVTVSTNKMDVLANSVLHQIVWTIADIKMHADSTLRALKLAVLLFTGTHQLWNFVTAYSVFPKKIPSIVVFDLNWWYLGGSRCTDASHVSSRDITLPLVNLVRWSNVLPLT